MKDNHIDYSDYYENGGNVDKSIPLNIRKQLYDENVGKKSIENFKSCQNPTIKRKKEIYSETTPYSEKCNSETSGKETNY